MSTPKGNQTRPTEIDLWDRYREINQQMENLIHQASEMAMVHAKELIAQDLPHEELLDELEAYHSQMVILDHDHPMHHYYWTLLRQFNYTDRNANPRYAKWEEAQLRAGLRF